MLKKETIRKIIPNKSTIFRLNPKNKTTGVKLRSAEWEVIMQIDGEKTLQGIISKLNFREEVVLSLVNNLFEKELIEIIDTADNKKEYAGEDFFQHLEKTLVEIIGPVAKYIIDDILLDLEEDRQTFLKEKMPLLTEAISQEIMDDDKRLKFQREMLAHIKKI